MEKQHVYEKLGGHLNQGVVGAPMSPALMEILTIMFTAEEAEIACRLPFEKKTLSELKDLFPEKSESLESLLADMAKNGTVYTEQKPGKERKYCLLPTVVGFSETPFWAGLDTERARKLAPLWCTYCNEAFGQELARNIPAMRVIPIDHSLKNKGEILPFDRVRDMLDAVSYYAVANCPCRQMMSYIGKGCDHTVENCLHFNDMARYMVEQGMAREVTKDEAISILEDADEEGLVHSCDNLNGYLSTICNCCGCCCVFLQTLKDMNLKVISSSNYISSVESATCIGCGTCEGRCPVQAIGVGDDETAHVNPTRCIGCGICVSTCPTESISLGLRASIAPPPDIAEFLAQRYLMPTG
ncbi:MAG: 4Fe-4S dicluster-binding protein [Desulfomonilia bacterium]